MGSGQGWKYTTVCLTACYKLLKPLRNRLSNAKAMPLEVESVRLSSGSKATLVDEALATLYWFIILKISAKHNLHQRMLPVDSLQQRDIYNCWVRHTTRGHLWIAVKGTLQAKYGFTSFYSTVHANFSSTISFFIRASVHKILLEMLFIAH